MIASSSAITTRVGLGTGRLRCSGASAGRELGRHAVEQSVLLALQVADGPGERVAMPGQRVSVAASIAGLDVAERRFGHERAQSGVVGFVLEERELLLRDRQLCP